MHAGQLTAEREAGVEHIGRRPGRLQTGAVPERVHVVQKLDPTCHVADLHGGPAGQSLISLQSQSPSIIPQLLAIGTSECERRQQLLLRYAGTFQSVRS